MLKEPGLPGVEKNFVTMNKYSLLKLKNHKQKEQKDQTQFYVSTSKSNPDLYNVLN